MVKTNFKVGTDIVKISRFANKSDKFAKRILHFEELNTFYNLVSETEKTRFLASRWSLKEAIFKATQFSSFRKINIKKQKNNSLKALIDGDFSKIIIEISLSYEKKYLLAFAVAHTTS